MYIYNKQFHISRTKQYQKLFKMNLNCQKKVLILSMQQVRYIQQKSVSLHCLQHFLWDRSHILGSHSRVLHKKRKGNGINTAIHAITCYMDTVKPSSRKLKCFYTGIRIDKKSFQWRQKQMFFRRTGTVLLTFNCSTRKA